ncbi:hypothetical protein GCM10010965_30340 [Caldalkalibacillus thermarum]|uniref:hypothetical protein n=1 Tax=Caldalkalibacillus thermarum TaxID=296745 RepID=UPI001664B792|nr:hypothetical protein [Caldalkalibacillus thermarum]GGK35262.1 hypothetical protein GCM10010965_30340 [Caldalkalibacillus thermarum]
MEDVLNQILGELHKVNNQLDGLEKGQKELKGEIQGLKNEVQELKQSQKELKTEILKNRESIDNLATEMRSHFRHLETNIEQHYKAFGVVSEKIRNIEYSVDFLGEKTGRHDMEINNIQKKLQSVSGD